MKKFPPVFLAVMPLLSQTLDGQTAFLTGGGIAFIFSLTGYFFSLTRNFFPKWAASFAPFIWILTLAQCGYYFGVISPQGVASLFLLFPSPFIKGSPRRFPKEPARFFWGRRSLAFWGFVLYLGFSQELLGKRLGLLIFSEPAGSWLLMGMAFVLVSYLKKGRESGLSEAKLS